MSNRQSYPPDPYPKDIQQVELTVTCPDTLAAKEAIAWLKEKGYLVIIKKIIGCLVILLLLPGCIATDDQLSQLVKTINEMKDTTVKAINTNQSNQAALAKEHLELARELYDDASKKQDPIAKPLHDRLVKAAVIADKAESLANLEIPDATKPESPIAGIIDALLNALMNNPTISGLIAALTAFTGYQMNKTRIAKKERNDLHAKREKLIKKVAAVATKKPEDVNLEKELEDV